MLTTGDFTQVVALTGTHQLDLEALDADGVNGYREYVGMPDLTGAGAAVGRGRYSQIAVVVDATGFPRVFALLAKGVRDSGSRVGGYGLRSVAGSFSQLSAAVNPADGTLCVFVVSRTGIEQATSPDGLTWTTSAVG